MAHEMADKIIGAINMAECYRRRVVRGQDINSWHNQLTEWETAGDLDSCLELLGEIIDVVETLPQYDAREPQPYWYEQAAKLHRRRGDHVRSMLVLERWLSHWPEERRRFDQARERVQHRVDGHRAKVSRS